MIPTMSDQLDHDLRNRHKNDPFEDDDDDRLFHTSMNGSVFADQLIHGVDPGILQGSELNTCEILMEQVREAAEQAKETFVAHMENHLRDLKDTMKYGCSVKQDRREDVDSKEKRKETRVSENQFVPRKSLLTELLQNKNIQTVNNIFIAVLVVIILNSALLQYLRVGSVSETFELAFWCLGKIPHVLYIWCQMMLWTTAVFFGTLSYWAHHPDPSSGPMMIPHIGWLLLYICGILAFLIYPPCAIIIHNLPILSSFIILLEQVRLLMKMHAFLRIIVPRALSWKQKVSGVNEATTNGRIESRSVSKVAGEHAPCPDFSLFLYYLFAPTLIYQDKYPMTDRIRWDVVRKNFFQCFVTGCYIFLMVVHFALPVTEKFAQEHYTIRDFIRTTFTFMIPAGACLFLGFYLILHCWLNAWAEMMRFADRLFYKDWWNSTSFASYYRDWNLVVHNWLYTYFYKDLRAIGLGPKMSLISVFLLSAFFHEYIIAVALRFCYPVLFVLFGIFGVMFMFVPDLGSANLRGTLVWLILFIGSGILLCLYSFEWFSRKNCPGDYEWYLDIFVPRSLVCNKLQFV